MADPLWNETDKGTAMINGPVWDLRHAVKGATR